MDLLTVHLISLRKFIPTSTWSARLNFRRNRLEKIQISISSNVFISSCVAFSKTYLCKKILKFILYFIDMLDLIYKAIQFTIVDDFEDDM